MKKVARVDQVVRSCCALTEGGGTGHIPSSTFPINVFLSTSSVQPEGRGSEGRKDSQKDSVESRFDSADGHISTTSSLINFIPRCAAI